MARLWGSWRIGASVSLRIGRRHLGGHNGAMDCPGQHRSGDAWLTDLAAIGIGVAMTLCIRGYQFGEGNHAVYLLDGLRGANPELLRTDWFVTSTLQYHGLFSWLVAASLRLRIIEPLFVCGYLGLAVWMHAGWLRLSRAIGLSRDGYLFSVILFYLCAGGLGLGMYHFLQDSAFLPSNVANVAMLWGIICWIEKKMLGAGFWFGIAGLFHLNHAIAALILWALVSAWGYRDIVRDRRWWKASAV